MLAQNLGVLESVMNDVDAVALSVDAADEAVLTSVSRNLETREQLINSFCLTTLNGPEAPCRPGLVFCTFCRNISFEPNFRPMDVTVDYLRYER